MTHATRKELLVSQVIGWAIGLAFALAYCTLAQAGNFAVYNRDEAFAERVGAVAEQCRRDLAIEWLGYELPAWQERCPIYVEDGEGLGAGGQTSFEFYGGAVGNWRMSVQGSRQRLLDSVVPHEVMHTVFASHFRQPLPRWLDEGSCSTVESGTERNKLQRMLVSYLQSDRGIPFDSLFAMREYPRDILPLYAQGHSLCTFLQQHESKPHFVAFVSKGLGGDWQNSLQAHYGYRHLGELQNTWLDWVKAGSPLVDQPQRVTANRLFGGLCGLRWVRGKGWVRQCQPQPRQPPQVVQPRPQPVQPVVPVAPPSQPPTDIRDLPPVAQSNQDLSQLVQAVEGIKQQLANLKSQPGPQGEPGPPGAPGKDGSDGKDGSSADEARLDKIDLASQNAVNAANFARRDVATLKKEVDSLFSRVKEVEISKKAQDQTIAELTDRITSLGQQMSGALRVRFKFDPQTGVLSPVQ